MKKKAIIALCCLAVCLCGAVFYMQQRPPRDVAPPAATDGAQEEPARRDAVSAQEEEKAPGASQGSLEKKMAEEGRRVKANLPKYAAGNGAFAQIAQAEKNLRPLKPEARLKALAEFYDEEKAYLPAKAKLNEAISEGGLPTAAQIQAYVAAEKKAYAEDAAIQKMTNALLQGGQISEDAYWQVIVPNQGLFMLVAENIANHRLKKEGKAPIYGKPGTRLPADAGA